MWELCEGDIVCGSTAGGVWSVSCITFEGDRHVTGDEGRGSCVPKEAGSWFVEGILGRRTGADGQAEFHIKWFESDETTWSWRSSLYLLTKLIEYCEVEGLPGKVPVKAVGRPLRVGRWRGRGR